MAYTPGSYQKAITELKNRIQYSIDTSGQKLYQKIQGCRVGPRLLTYGDVDLPLISINILPGNVEEFVSQCGPASQKMGIINLEIELVAKKLKTTDEVYQENAYFDADGNGILPLWENLLDVLDDDSTGVFDPSLELSLDDYPRISTDVDDDREDQFIFTINASLHVKRFTVGGRSGVTS